MLPQFLLDGAFAFLAANAPHQQTKPSYYSCEKDIPSTLGVLQYNIVG